MAKGKKETKLREWQIRNKDEQQICGKCGNLRWCTVDHIVPYFFIDQLGLRMESMDDEWNFQPLCRACSGLKNARFDFTDPRTMTNLRRYVDKAERYYGAESAPIN